MCGPRGLRFQKPVTLTIPRFHTHNPESEVEGGETEGNRSSSSTSSSWSLRVMHAATHSDGATSTSEVETRQHSLRKWHTVCPSTTNAELGKSSQIVTSKPCKLLSGTESDSSGAAIACQIADSLISLLIDHF